MDRVAAAFKWLIGYVKKRQAAIYETMKENNTWKRMIRVTIATTLAVAIVLIHYDSNPTFGKGGYLAAMVTLFVHPGRRVGQLIEALVLALVGLVLGVLWSALGIWLGSFVIYTNPDGGYAIRAVFLVIALFFHGFLRSQVPRSFLMLLLFIIIALQGLTTTAKQMSISLVTNMAYPVLLASGLILVVNILVLPEFSSGFLGRTTISSLDAVADSIKKSGSYFVGQKQQKRADGIVEDDENQGPKLKKNKDSASPDHATLSDITASKSDLRAKLNANRSAQNETQFEIAISHLPPYRLSPISKKAMKRLVTHTIAMIGCCETRFALLGDDAPSTSKDAPKKVVRTRTGLDTRGVDLSRLKAKKEIEYGDVRLLRYLFTRIRDPYLSFQEPMLRSIDAVKSCIAYAYDVSGTNSTSMDIETRLTQLNKHYDEFQVAIQQFDNDITMTLEGAASIQEMKGESLDIMPREEIFLIASFLLSVRQAATQISEMLACAKLLVQERSEASSWRRFFVPRIRWRKWLYSGGESDEGNPPSERRSEKQQEEKRTDDSGLNPLLQKPSKDLEEATPRIVIPQAVKTEKKASKPSKSNEEATFMLRARNKLADFLQWLQHSEDVLYAFKLSFATFLVTFPAFIPSLNAFFYEKRGSWAALQLIFVFDVAIGTSIENAYLRAIGTSLGSVWGWAAYSVGNGNPVACVFMLMIGLIPASYVQLGSRYVKAGTVTMVSMCVVALATELQTVPGTSVENFLTRWVAFLVGGVVALLVEVILLPVKARTRLVESLAAAIRRISQMETYLAYGVENSAVLKNGFPVHAFASFEKASKKAKARLDDADTFFPFCKSEPRLKGSFEKMAKVYEEIIFVLRQIVDRMDNMLQLRMAYGAGPLEEFNDQIYAYRRNVAGSTSMTLYAVHEALMTKYPLPQFIPSARLAQLRLINRVREVIQELADSAGTEEGADKRAVSRTLRRKYMSWSAASAAQVELIEYLEELTNLVKLLVGANEFKSGLLARPTLQQYAKSSGALEDEFPLPEIVLAPSNDDDGDLVSNFEAHRAGADPSLPISLQRIQSRKQEAGLRKRISNDESRSRSSQGRRSLASD